MMFGSNATRLARIDWSKYGAMELAGVDDPTPEQLKRAVVGLSAGIRQLAEELANCLGNVDVPMQNRAPFISVNYTPDAPGVSPDNEDLDSFFPNIGGVAGDGYFSDDGNVYGGQAGFFRGPLIFQPAINNPNVLGGAAINNVVLIGGIGAGIAFDNIYVTNLYDRTTGSPITSASTIAYIKVGLTTSAPAAQTIAAGATLEVAWSNDDTINTDGTVLSQDGADPSYPNIVVAVAGTYRVFYKIGVGKNNTHTTDERLSVASHIVRDRSGADTIVGGVDGIDVWYSESLGLFRQSSVGETAVECLAGDKLRIDMTMSSGPTREAFLQYGEFCVMLLKRA